MDIEKQKKIVSLKFTLLSMVTNSSMKRSVDSFEVSRHTFFDKNTQTQMYFFRKFYGYFICVVLNGKFLTKIKENWKKLKKKKKNFLANKGKKNKWILQIFLSM